MKVYLSVAMDGIARMGFLAAVRMAGFVEDDGPPAWRMTQATALDVPADAAGSGSGSTTLIQAVGQPGPYNTTALPSGCELISRLVGQSPISRHRSDVQTSTSVTEGTSRSSDRGEGRLTLEGLRPYP